MSLFYCDTCRYPFLMDLYNLLRSNRVPHFRKKECKETHQYQRQDVREIDKQKNAETY